MKELVTRFVELEQRLSENNGRFALFALFLREDSVDKWDLVVAAPWIEDNRKRALSHITQQVQDAFSVDELSTLSRIVLVELANPAVAAVNQAVRIEHGQAEIRDSNFFGLQIKHAYVISSERVNIGDEVPA